MLLVQVEFEIKCRGRKELNVVLCKLSERARENIKCNRDDGFLYTANFHQLPKNLKWKKSSIKYDEKELSASLLVVYCGHIQ